jgi:hypothetical protein
MLSGLLGFNKAAPSSQVIAARVNAAGARSAALHAACGEAEEARAKLAASKEKRAAIERELAELPRPGVDLDAAARYRSRKADLELVLEEYGPLIAAEEEEVASREAAVSAARAALAEAAGEIDAPLVDAAADMPRLRAAAEKAGHTHEKERVTEARVQSDAAPALAAYQAVMREGAPADEAVRIFEAARHARAKIETAREAAEVAEAAQNDARARMEALEAAIDRDERRAKFNQRRGRLEAQRAGLEAAIESCEDAGEAVGSLFATCDEWLKRFKYHVERVSGYDERNDKWLMRDPRFASAARVPRLKQDGEFFVIDSYRHDYKQFDLRGDILAPLVESLTPNAELAKLRQAAYAVFDREYRALALPLLEPMAIMFLWRVERESAFADAGDLARGVAMPAWPLQASVGGEILPWRRLSLPSLDPRGEPLWHPDWPGARLVELTSHAEAA